MKTLALAALAVLTGCCRKNEITIGHGDLRVRVEKGSAWLHEFPLFMGIKIHNAPQIAIWTESPEGEYLATLYVSRRTATDKWRGGKNIERPEALPTWSHASGHAGGFDGIVPAGVSNAVQRGSADAVSDAVTGATPRGSFEVKMRPAAGVRQFVVKVELNHSRDWNDAWPEDATRDATNHNAESGQPSVVYAATVDLDAVAASEVVGAGSGVMHFEAHPIGHGSPDGRDGNIRPDISSLTSALDIAKSITVEIGS